VPQSNQQLTHTHTAELARVIMSDRQAQEFEATKECNFAISPAGIGRFRANAFIQQGQVGLVLRTIPSASPTSTSSACRRCSRTSPCPSAAW
jgi:twitching motility protein PilU